MFYVCVLGVWGGVCWCGGGGVTPLQGSGESKNTLGFIGFENQKKVLSPR